MLQALELLTGGCNQLTWIKANDLREQMARLLGQISELMGDGQRIGHIIMRLHLADEGRRKRANDGITYAIQPEEVLDMMRRYDVLSVWCSISKRKPFTPFTASLRIREGCEWFSEVRRMPILCSHNCAYCRSCPTIISMTTATPPIVPRLDFSTAAGQSMLCSPSAAESNQPSDGNRGKLLGRVLVDNCHAEP